MATTGEPSWAELLGSNNWAGLLDPLSLPLRRLILLAGDLSQATYDAFNNDQVSPFCGTSRYGKSSFFRKVMLPSSSTAAFLSAGDGLTVASFLYATARVGVPEALLLHSFSRDAWDRESNWIGYVAVTSDPAAEVAGRRDVYVAWRGTTRSYEWVNVLGAKFQSIRPLLKSDNRSQQTPIETGTNTSSSSSSSSDDDDEGSPKVMQGWLTIYTSENANSPFTKLSARTQLATQIRRLVDEYKHTRKEKMSIVITGHSLGASLSVISAFDLVQNVVPEDIPVTALVFGSPQIGNKAFDEGLKKLPNLRVLHVRNKIDLIPHYPGRLLGYVDTGTELEVDTRKSPRLKESKNTSDWHNLQATLHAVAGWNGAEGGFEMRVERSLALVNKSCGFLKDECLVPEAWWVEKNKGMVLREENGEWEFAPPDDEDLPVPEF